MQFALVGSPPPVLSYRLVTYWLPILPGWISLHALERRGYV